MACDSTRGRDLSVSGEACGGLHVICSIGMRLAALVWTCVEILPHGKICHPELVVSWTSGLSLSHCGYHLTTSISFVPLWFSWMCLITSRVLRALYARYVAGLTTLLQCCSVFAALFSPTCTLYITFELQSTPASTVCTARNTLHLRRYHAQRHPPLLLQTHSQRQTRAALYRDRDGVHQVSANGGLFPPRAVLPSRVLDRCDELLC